MNSRRVVWVEVSILCALLIFTLLTLLEVPNLVFPFKIAMYAGVGYLLLLLQPSKIFAGRAKLSDDLWTTIGVLLLGSPILFSGELTDVGVAIGFLMLFVATLVLMRNIHPKSLLGTFHQHRVRNLPRFFVTWLFVLVLFVAFFQPFMRFFLWISQYTWVTLMVILLILFALLEEHNAFHVQWLEKLWKRVRGFGSDLLKLFLHQRTFLLGIAGLLVAQFIMNVLMGLHNATITGFVNLGGSWQLTIGALSYIGLLVLIVLTPYVWFKTVLVRRSHVHVPDWNIFAVCSVLAVIVIALLYPLITFVPLLGEEVYGAILDGNMPHNSPKMTAIMGVLVFIIALTIAKLDDFLRRALMTGPFLAAIVFMGMYVFSSFESLFSYTVQEYLGSLSSWTIFIYPITVILFLVSSVFLITGFMSFLYEIWRE